MRFLLATLVCIGSAFFWTTQAVLATCCKCQGTDSSKNICLTIDKGGCQTISTYYPTNSTLQTLSCEMLDDAFCKPISENGQCHELGVAQFYGQPVNTNQSVTNTQAIVPTLGVPIRGLIFSPSFPTDGGIARIPFLAQYVKGIYDFLMGISVIVSGVMIVYGGFLFILGSTISTISTGKKYITNALSGLVIIFSLTTLVYTLNPDLLTLQPLNVKSVSQQSFQDILQERQRVEDAARIKSSDSEEVPFIDLNTETVTITRPSIVSPTTQEPEKKPIAQDPQGNLIAQGECPEDMKPIPGSDEYEKKTKIHVAPFCMDTFEAPNQPGHKPFIGVHEFEADWYCQSIGKRLCTEDEWTRACLGPKAENKYGYAPDFIYGQSGTTIRNDGKKIKDYTCNFDKPGLVPNWSKFTNPLLIATKPEFSVLNLTNPKLSDSKYKNLFDVMKLEINRLNKTEPSGSRPLCVTAEGVYDLPANAQEIVVRRGHEKESTDQRTKTSLTATYDAKPYVWKGYFWIALGGHGAGTEHEPICDTRWGGNHAMGFRTYENSFRCCMNLAEGR